jgi:two-component system chemotaxis response regulator CheY
MDAIEKMSSLETPVDLIITDLNMPNLDGYRLIETVRHNEQHRDTPIIILSSENSEGDRQRGLEVGANSYLLKPFESEKLLQEVSQYLK